MPKPISIDLLFFDFDGTLTDSIPPAIVAIQQMLAELKLPFKSKEEIHRHVGFGEVPLVSGALGSKDSKLIEAAMKSYFKYYMGEGLKEIKLYPHVRKFLERFKDKPKIIVSNKSDRFIKLILGYHGLENYFTEIVGGDTALTLKPDPGTLNGLLAKYKIPPKRAIFVGDMTVDIATGKNAGVYTCAVTYGFDTEEKLAKHNPDFLVGDILELVKLIK